MNQAPSYAGRFERPLSGLDALLSWVVRLVWMNFWWLVLTLLGGVILGIGPATAAAHTVVGAWLRGDQEVSVPRTMWTTWKVTWRQAAPTGALAMLLGVALAATWLLSRGQPPIPAAITQGLVLLVGLLWLVSVPHLMWIIARYHDQHLGIARLFTAGLAAGVTRPLLTLVLVVLGAGWPIFLILIEWPGLIPPTIAAIPITAGTWCINRTFPDAPPEDETDI